jgi:hypothetical protein
MLILLISVEISNVTWAKLQTLSKHTWEVIEASLSGSVVSIYHIASAIFMNREEVKCHVMRKEYHHYDTLLTRSQFSILINVRWHSLLRLMINHKRPHFIFAHGPQPGDGPHGINTFRWIKHMIISCPVYNRNMLNKNLSSRTHQQHQLQWVYDAQTTFDGWSASSTWLGDTPGVVVGISTNFKDKIWK